MSAAPGTPAEVRLPALRAAALALALAGCAAPGPPPGASAPPAPPPAASGRAAPDEALGLYNQAQDLLRRGDAAGAERALRAALAANPRLYPAYGGLARLYEDQDRLPEAVSLYRRLLELRPRDAEAHVALGRLAERAGQTERAIYRYERALAIDPGILLAHYRLALIRRARGQVDDAIVHLRAVLRLSPGHRPARLLLWRSLAERGGGGEEELALARGLVAEGDAAPIRFYRGAAARLFREGKPEEALRTLQKAVDVNPDWREPRWRGVLEDMARYRRALR